MFFKQLNIFLILNVTEIIFFIMILIKRKNLKLKYK